MIATGNGIDYQFAFKLMQTPTVTVRRFNLPAPSKSISRTLSLAIFGTEGAGKSTMIDSLCQRGYTLSRSTPAPGRKGLFSLPQVATLQSIRSNELVSIHIQESPEISISEKFDLAIIAFDISDRQSFCEAKTKWEHLVECFFDVETAPKCLLVGTKADKTSQRKVSFQDATELASTLHSRYVETNFGAPESYDRALCQLVSSGVEREPVILALDQIPSRAELPPMVSNLKKKKSVFGGKVAKFLRKSLTGL